MSVFVSEKAHDVCLCGVGGVGRVCVCGWGRMYVCMHINMCERETEKETVGGIALSNIGKRNIVC